MKGALLREREQFAWICIPVARLFRIQAFKGIPTPKSNVLPSPATAHKTY
jgi:hypothetical protein